MLQDAMLQLNSFKTGTVSKPSKLKHWTNPKEKENSNTVTKKKKNSSLIKKKKHNDKHSDNQNTVPCSHQQSLTLVMSPFASQSKEKTEIWDEDISKRVKTTDSGFDGKIDSDFLNIFSNTTQEFIRSHKPFLDNKKIVFNMKNKNRNNSVCKATTEPEEEAPQRESHIERLKKQILELDKEEFVSYRANRGRLCFEEAAENSNINKYNFQNSLIAEWRGQGFQKSGISRPSSTIGILNPPPGSFISSTNQSLMAKKYFSKPKQKRLFIPHNFTTTISAKGLDKNQFSFQKNKRMLKQQQIAIGLSMFRGKLQRKKINSTFQIKL